MSVSDEMMWRYWELLTDVSLAEIGNMRQDVSSGHAHPMNVKKDLARRIVTDFHSKDAAKQAQEDWADQFQRDQVPENVERVSVAYLDVAAGGDDGHKIRLDKLLARCGLAESVSDGSRKIKQKAVRIDGEVTTDLVFPVPLPVELLVRVGRNMKKVAIGS
jgi:tyrosyl-tRNA synthetase